MAIELSPDTGRIHSDPAIMVGKPVVRGTRIPVTVIPDKFASDLDLGDLFAAYPELELEDVRAALAYASSVVDTEYRRSRRRPEESAAKA